MEHGKSQQFHNFAALFSCFHLLQKALLFITKSVIATTLKVFQDNSNSLGDKGQSINVRDFFGSFLSGAYSHGIAREIKEWNTRAIRVLLKMSNPLVRA